MIKSFKFNFPGVNVKGCLFHFGQSLQKNLKRLGLKILYNQNVEFNKWIRLIFSMALVPIGDVDTVWAKVNATRPTYTRFLAPVEDNVVAVKNNVDAGEDNVRSILRPPRGRRSRGARGGRGSRGGTVTIPAPTISIISQ